MARYALVDVANLIFRARHVVRGDAFTKTGMALHIIFRSLRKLYVEHKCDHVVLCLEGRSWRYDVYPQYKARRRLEKLKRTEREKEEDDVFQEVYEDFVKFMDEKTRVTVLSSPGVEGDDFIARWIQIHPNDEHIILSGDSDFVQLIAPNVSIYNGVDNRLITIDGVFNEKNEPMVFFVAPASGKLTVRETIAQAKKKHDGQQKAAATAANKAGQSYTPIPYSFTPEKEWWKKALFVKIVRGDKGDGIFPAYPGVRYTGTKNKVGICEAWDDRNDKGFHWNNFMLQSSEKALPDGTKKTVRVLDEYAFNESLIDLTMQPDHIKDLMDQVIIDAVQKEPVGNVGLSFLQFCNKHQLNNLAKEAYDHAHYLNARYGKGSQ